MPNLLTTSHSEDSEGGLGNYLYNNNSIINSLARYDHNHPGGNVQPSFKITDNGELRGDIGQVCHFNDYYPNNHINYNIYTLNNGRWGYYNYNEKTLIYNGTNNNYIPNVPIYGKKK